MIKKFLVVLMTMIMLSQVQSFADTPSVIREDRVWEYVRRNCHYWEVFQVKFDGAEEIKGQQYALLRTIKHFRVYDGPDMSVPKTLENLMAPGKDEIVRMREDLGAVYRLIDYCGETLELMVYDFNVSEGDEIMLPVGYGYVSGEGFNNMFPHVQIDGYEGYPYRFMYKVVSKGVEEIGGEECEYIEIEFCGDPELAFCVSDTSYKIIDGIGPARGKIDHLLSGTLAMLEAYDPTTGLDVDAECYSLNRVYTADEDVIYRAADIDWHKCIEEADVNGMNAEICPAAYYSLQGVRLERPGKGEVVISVEGGKSSKIAF